MMNRSSVLAVVLTLAVAFAAPVAAGSLVAPGSGSASGTAQTGTTLAASEQNNSSENDSVSPGAQLAGVVSVQGAEVSGEVEHRAFGHRMAAANSNASKASVIAAQSQDLDARLDEIQAQQQTLQAKYENGTISTGQYKARMAKLAAEARTIQRLLNTTATSAETLPSGELAAKGISVESINALRESANNLTGPEVAAIAREIGGPSAGTGTPGLGNETRGNVSVGGPGNGMGDAPGNGSGGAPGNGTPGAGSAGAGNQTTGNGSAAPSDDSTTTDSPENASNTMVSGLYTMSFLVEDLFADFLTTR